MKLANFSNKFHHRRRGVKSALMDQRFLFGIGNVYSDEMLFQARIRPNTRTGDLDDGRLRDLHRAMLHTLHIAISRPEPVTRLLAVAAPEEWRRLSAMRRACATKTNCRADGLFLRTVPRMTNRACPHKRQESAEGFSPAAADPRTRSSSLAAGLPLQ